MKKNEFTLLLLLLFLWVYPQGKTTETKTPPPKATPPIASQKQDVKTLKLSQKQQPKKQDAKQQKKTATTDTDKDFNNSTNFSNLDSIKRFKAQDIGVVSDLKEILTDKEKDKIEKAKEKQKESEDKIQDKKEKIEKENEEKDKKQKPDVDYNEEVKANYQRHMLSYGQATLYHAKGVIPVVLSGKLYLFLKGDNGDNKMYSVDKKYHFKLLDDDLPFDVSTSQILRNSKGLSVLTLTKDKLYVLWNKQRSQEPWVKTVLTFHIEDIDQTKNVLLQSYIKDNDSSETSDDKTKSSDSDESTQPQDGSLKKLSEIPIDILKTHFIHYKDKSFLFTNNRMLWFSSDMQNWYPIIIETPWLGDDLYYPFVHQGKLVVFGSLGTNLMKKWESSDGLTWSLRVSNEGKSFPIRRGFRVVSLSKKMILLGGKDDKYKRYGDKSFDTTSYTDLDEEKKKEELEQKEEEEAQKAEEEEDSDLSEQDKAEKDAKDKEQEENNTDFGFDDNSNKELDLNSDLVDEKLYKGTSREVIHPDKKFYRADKNDIELDSILKKTESKLGIYSTTDAHHWTYLTDAFSRANQVNIIRYNQHFISFGYKGTLSGEDIFDLKESTDMKKWRDIPLQQDNKKGQKPLAEDIYRSIDGGLYVIKKKKSSYSVLKVDREGKNDGKKILDIPLNRIDFISQNSRGGFFVIKSNKMWFVHFNLKWANPIDLPFESKDIESSFVQGDDLTFFTHHGKGSVQEVYRYHLNKIEKVATFNLDLQHYGVDFFKGQYFLMGGVDHQGEVHNDVRVSSDMKKWRLQPRFVMKEVKDKVSEDEKQSTQDNSTQDNSTQDNSTQDNSTQDNDKSKAIVKPSIKPKDEKKIKVRKNYLYYSPRYSFKTLHKEGELYIIGGKNKGSMGLKDIWSTQDGLEWNYKGEFSKTFDKDKMLVFKNQFYLFDSDDGNVEGDFIVDFKTKEKEVSPDFGYQKPPKEENQDDEGDDSDSSQVPSTSTTEN